MTLCLLRRSTLFLLICPLSGAFSLQYSVCECVCVCVHVRAQSDFPGGSVVKSLPAMQATQVRSLGWEDPREEGRATYFSSPAEFHGQRSLMGYSPQGHTDLDMTERPQQQQQRRAQSRPVLCSSMHCDEAPLSRQEYRRGLPLPTRRDCPNPGSEPTYSCISCTGRRNL